MKGCCSKLPKIFAGVIFIAIFSCSAIATDDVANSDQATQQVTLVYEPTHNPPRALGRGTLIDWSKPGLTLELLKLVGDRLDIKFNFKRVPWKRGLYLLEKNEVDGVFHASYKSSREGIGVYPMLDDRPDQSLAIYTNSYALYKTSGSKLDFDGEKITDIAGVIGAISDYAIVGDLKAKGYDVETASSQAINFRKLVEGKIAAFAMLENMADDFLRRNSDLFTNIVKVSQPLRTKPYYLLLSHKFVQENRSLAEKIWRTMAVVNESDEFNGIIGQY